MHIPLRETLEHLWASLWRSRGRGVADERNDDQRGRDRNAARSRFWTELREGQREAEARSARLRS
jgi:hypothetical protein